MNVIKNRYSGNIIAEGDETTLVLAQNNKNNLREAILQGANLRGANLREANLREAILYGANLYGANLREANLREAILYGANLHGANLREAILYEANLQGANLQGANLYGANLYGANLYGADLYGADLYGADLYGANLYGANLYGADLREAKYGIEEIINKYFTIGPIGSRSDYLQIFLTNKQTIIKTGCFSGSLESFEHTVSKKEQTSIYYKEYQGAITFIKHMIETHSTANQTIE